MKCQMLFSGQNKKAVINLPSAEFAHSIVSINISGFSTKKYSLHLVCTHKKRKKKKKKQESDYN